MMRFLAFALAIVLPPACALSAQGVATRSDSDAVGRTDGPGSGDVVAANFHDGSVSWFRGETGEFGGILVDPGSGGLSAATGVAFGPDGDLYVGSSATHQILRYDGVSGDFIDSFTEPGVVRRPFSLIFEDDGSLLVSSGHAVFRLDTDGMIRDTLVTAPGINTPIGLRVEGPGRLLVASAGSNQIVRLADRRVADVWSPEGASFPSDVLPTADGIWVSNAFASELLLLDTITGEVLGRHMLPADGVPVGIALRSDGTLFVADFGADRLLGFDPNTGVFSVLSAEGLRGPENLAIKP